MSFYPQPYKYQCGPFALKYALVMLGQFKDEKDISLKAGSSWWYGTDEIGLAKASRAYKCKMKHFKSDDRAEALKFLIGHLKEGRPSILSVENWGHWLTVVNYHKNKFIAIDSDLDKVIVVYSPNQLLKRWKYSDSESDEISYDGYAVIPTYKVRTKAHFSLDRAKYVMRESNRDLAEKWDKYFNDLINICKPMNGNLHRTLSFAEFLRRYEKLLVTETANWHGSPTYPELKKILKNMRFVAEVYDLVISIKDQKKALVDIALLLMMYSCGKYGMDNIY